MHLPGPYGIIRKEEEWKKFALLHNMWFDKGNRCFKYLIKNKLGASLRSRLRDLALSLQQPGSLLSLGLSGNFLMPEAWPKKKKKKQGWRCRSPSSAMCMWLDNWSHVPITTGEHCSMEMNEAILRQCPVLLHEITWITTL